MQSVYTRWFIGILLSHIRRLHRSTSNLWSALTALSPSAMSSEPNGSWPKGLPKGRFRRFRRYGVLPPLNSELGTRNSELETRAEGEWGF